MRWDKNLSYLLRVKSRDGQYNAPVTLFIKVGTLNVGQEKSTELGWYDATGDYPTVRGDWTFRLVGNAQLIDIVKPGGTTENDLLIAFLATDGVEDHASPSGWTGIASVSSDANTLGAWYRVATASEPGAYRFTWSSNEGAIGSMIRITSADTSSPIHANTTAFSSVSGAITAPDITSTVDNCVILRVHGLDDNDEGDDYDAFPVGHIGIFSKDGGTTSQSIAYENLSGQGSAGTAAWVGFINSEEWVAFSIAVAPLVATLPSQSGESPTNNSDSVAVNPSLYVV